MAGRLCKQAGRLEVMCLYQQHDAAFCLHEGLRETHDHGIDLSGCHRLAVFTDMETLAVYDVRYLFGPQPAIALGKDI